MVEKIISGFVFASLALLISAKAGAQPPAAHVHGVAILEASLDGQLLELRLDSPLANLLRFEHRPANAAEHAAAKSMKNQLARPDRLFGLPADAGCSLRTVSIMAPSLDAVSAKPGQDAVKPPAESGKASAHADPAARSASARRHEKKHEHEHDNPAAQHADLTANYVFACRKPAALSHVDVSLFRVFPGIEKINVQSVGPKGQSATELSKSATRLAW